MISELDAIKYNQQRTKKSLPFLYAIENYQPLIAEKIATHTFKYKNLPEDIAKKYGQEYIFKGITGKRRGAVIVFNQDMLIADIQLLPKADK